MFFAPFSRRAPTARLRQVAIARGVPSVRHRARGQAEDDGQRVPHSSQPDLLLSARTPSPAAHPMHERRPHLHLSHQPRRGSTPGTVGWLRPTVPGDAGHRGAMDMRQEPSARAPFTASGHETDARRLRRSPADPPSTIAARDNPSDKCAAFLTQRLDQPVEFISRVVQRRSHAYSISSRDAGTRHSEDSVLLQQNL